ncbi:MAG: class I SAM-dependent methyltransferase, partial [Planctomycetota bacterium]
MNRNTRYRAQTAVILLFAFGTFVANALGGNPTREAQRILNATDVKGGVIVQIGCGDGKLTAALRADDGYVVHGLDRDPANVAMAREHIRSLGQYGGVSIELWSGERLPYIDNSVNLIVAENIGGVRESELMRV